MHVAFAKRYIFQPCQQFKMGTNYVYGRIQLVISPLLSQNRRGSFSLLKSAFLNFQFKIVLKTLCNLIDFIMKHFFFYKSWTIMCTIGLLWAFKIQLDGTFCGKKWTQLMIKSMVFQYLSAVSTDQSNFWLYVFISISLNSTSQKVLTPLWTSKREILLSSQAHACPDYAISTALKFCKLFFFSFQQ